MQLSKDRITRKKAIAGFEVPARSQVQHNITGGMAADNQEVNKYAMQCAMCAQREEQDQLAHTGKQSRMWLLGINV